MVATEREVSTCNADAVTLESRVRDRCFVNPRVTDDRRFAWTSFFLA